MEKSGITSFLTLDVFFSQFFLLPYNCYGFYFVNRGQPIANYLVKVRFIIVVLTGIKNDKFPLLLLLLLLLLCSIPYFSN